LFTPCSFLKIEEMESSSLLSLANLSIQMLKFHKYPVMKVIQVDKF
jgi:hypothetical protein